MVGSSEALRYLESASRPNFERAYVKSGGQRDSVETSLFAAADRLEEVVPLVSEYTDSEGVEDGVRQTSRFLSQILLHFDDIRQQYFGDDA